MAMKLALAGINHRTAPVDVREKLAFREEEIPAALVRVQASGAREALILSTCNRVEVTAALVDEVPPHMLFESIASGRDGLSLDTLTPYLYLYEERDVMRHLFRVAAGLDSMIVGEPQILGQLKQAYAQAREHGSIGSLLDAVLTRSFSVAKRIRSETEIGHSAVSVSYAAVELAREIFGSLKKKRVLIIGAGKMSEGAARHLLGAGAAEILIANRTPERAEEIARVFRGEVVPYDLLAHRLAEVDIVIASSSAPYYVLTKEVVRRAIEVRKNQPMFLIDIAVPRNIEPEVNGVDHAFLYDIDDLQQVADRNLRARYEVAQQAESIVTEEVERLAARLRARDVTPTIVSLQEQLETIRREVLERHRARMGALNSAQEEALEALTRGLVNKIAHGPISELRRQAEVETAGEAAPESELASAVRRIFRLRER
ncbi:MAG TPA: glutamyl-tRNA reductase [Bryobacteraceae bacterium]|jgi:glutamyl-tRNA reductase|nr:glutamyl-tRNA reductase [Bryobacteraceae bacterium]